MRKLCKFILILMFGIVLSISNGVVNPTKALATELESVSTESVINVTGSGVVNAKADIVYIYLNVSTKNAEAKVAQSENNVKTKAVLEKLRSHGITDANINTEGYTLSPLYKQLDAKKMTNSDIEAYIASAPIRVSVRDLTTVGAVIDSAIATGVTRVDSVEFALEDTTEYYNKALEIAGRNARSKAESLGNSLGVKIKSVLTIDEQEDYNPRNYSKRASVDNYAMPSLAATMPMQVDTLEVTARIRATFLVTEKGE